MFSFIMSAPRAFNFDEQPPPGPSRPTRRRHTVVPGEPVVEPRLGILLGSQVLQCDGVVGSSFRGEGSLENQLCYAIKTRSSARGISFIFFWRAEDLVINLTNQLSRLIGSRS